MDDEELTELLKDMVNAVCDMAENVEVIARAINPNEYQKEDFINDDPGQK